MGVLGVASLGRSRLEGLYFPPVGKGQRGYYTSCPRTLISSSALLPLVFWNVAFTEVPMRLENMGGGTQLAPHPPESKSHWTSRLLLMSGSGRRPASPWGLIQQVF